MDEGVGGENEPFLQAFDDEPYRSVRHLLTPSLKPLQG
jgi:hypothetical protein